MEQAEIIGQFDKIQEALAKAQGKFPPIPKDSEVEVKKDGKLLYKFKYADLTTIIDKTRPALSENGISFTQGMTQGGFVTTLMHSSGQSMKSGFIPVDVPKNADMKTVAGLITYVKRISLTAALGVSADEDVDAAGTDAAQGNTTDRRDLPKTTPPVSTAPNTKPGNNVQAPASNQVDPNKAAAKPAPPQNAPADKATMDRILDLMIDRQVHENSVNNLIAQGYGFKSPPPVWVALEIIGLLENEDCNDQTIERKYNEVLKRREAAQQKGK